MFDVNNKFLIKKLENVMFHRKFLFPVLFLFLLSSSLYSQLKSLDALWTFEVGSTVLNASEIDVALNGYSFTATFDQITSSKELSGGVTFGYMRSTTKVGNEEYAYSSLPLIMQGKYFLATGSVPFYLQGGVGMHFSRLDRTTEVLYLQFSDVGLVLNAGTGILIPLGSDVYLSLAYQFNWYETTFYNDGMVHLFKIGLGFN